jgi:ribose transport system permease protein
MKRAYGVLGLLGAICLITLAIEPSFLAEANLYNIVRWTALYGVISIGVAFVIITGGIDLSIGSVVALTGCLLALFLSVSHTDTGQKFKVVSVDADNRIIMLDGDTSQLQHHDKLRFFDRANRANEYMIDHRADLPAGFKNAVAVREKKVEQLEKGTELIWLKMDPQMHPVTAVILVLLIGCAVGLIHGLLITKMKLQPFVVTLCGLLIYRGLTRVMAGDSNVGFGVYHSGLKYLAIGKPFSIPLPGVRWIAEGRWSSINHVQEQGEWVPEVHKVGARMMDEAGNPMLDSAGKVMQYAADTPELLDFWGWVAIPMPMLIMVFLGIVGAIFLNKTIYGRYLLALGRNEKAAQFSGINTDRMVILSYVICSCLAALGGILFVLDLNSVQPNTHGGYYELYAIAAAVLGGCSLRGGEGSVFGVIVGAAMMRTLRNSINMLGIPIQLEFAIIGGVILIGVVADELVKRVVAQRRRILQTRQMMADEGTAKPPPSSSDPPPTADQPPTSA